MIRMMPMPRSPPRTSCGAGSRQARLQQAIAGASVQCSKLVSGWCAPMSHKDCPPPGTPVQRGPGVGSCRWVLQDHSTTRNCLSASHKAVQSAILMAPHNGLQSASNSCAMHCTPPSHLRQVPEKGHRGRYPRSVRPPLDPDRRRRRSAAGWSGPCDSDASLL